MTADVHQLRQEFQEHRDYCERRFDEGQLKFDELIACVTDNTRAVTQASESITNLNAQTKDVVEAYSNIQGAVRVGFAVQKFGLWVMSLGAIISAGYYCVKEFLTK